MSRPMLVTAVAYTLLHLAQRHPPVDDPVNAALAEGVNQGSAERGCSSSIERAGGYDT